MQLNPYLSFNGNCREAMEFYKQALGAELVLNAVGDSQVKDQFPPEKQNWTMHASLSKDGQVLMMASDKMDPGELIMGNNNWLSLQCASEEEINTLFANLSAGGTVIMPVAKQFWGDMFGMCTDKFGMHWMLNCQKK